MNLFKSYSTQYAKIRFSEPGRLILILKYLNTVSITDETDHFQGGLNNCNLSIKS